MPDHLDEMRALGVFSDEELEAITPELIRKGEEEAEELPQGQYPEGAAPAFRIWTGNHFRISNKIWYWEDQPGSQCGRKRTWKYTPQPGASYGRAEKCPQGYYWYRMSIP
ncbi:hypothetical protein AAG594_04245 [Citromicrobium bathyomarinum]